MPEHFEDSVQVTPARIEDAKAIAAINVTGWQVAYQGIFPEEFLSGLSVESSESNWRQAIARGKPHVLVARKQGTVVGWIAFGESREPDATPADGEIWAVYVHPDHWAQQTGSQLWRNAQEALKESGFTSVVLWVLVNNARAIAFYRKHGFQEQAASTKDIERGGVLVAEVRYARAI